MQRHADTELNFTFASQDFVIGIRSTDGTQIRCLPKSNLVTLAARDSQLNSHIRLPIGNGCKSLRHPRATIRLKCRASSKLCQVTSQLLETLESAR